MAIDAADSGFLSNINNTVVPAPVWNYTVTSKDPTWWYCAQSTHCGKGMVFAINPTCEKTFGAFRDAAIALNGTLSSPPAAASSTSAVAAAATHNIIVGGESGLVYTPSEIIAAVGDVVHFVFMKQNHTVTQSTFGAPCNKISAEGIDSGFMSNINDTITPAPTFDYTVTATEPTWWYCAQTTHCGKGMVFAINPTAEKTFKAFQDAAIALNGTAATTTAAAATELATTTAAVVTGTAVPGAACACQCLCPAAAFKVAEAINPPGLPAIPTQAESTMTTVVRTGFISAIDPTSILIADPVSSIAESLVLDTSVLTAAEITTVATATTTALSSSLDLTVPLAAGKTAEFIAINFSTVSLGDLQTEWTGKLGPTPA
ncbi:Cupredoxin [Morchella conica CCBAS932]|uniref:Cupredoxin n=1 Tax=Morchella conica CCBAS932 TaxID=1392247 RepID=A0A3N4KDS0_9PEZI|nr:Cupredoxin [Morchella conica CCBAS932]